MTPPNPKSRPSQPAIHAAGPAERASAASLADGPSGSTGSTGATARRTTTPADKREAILEAALALFVERGFYGTAVPEIADRAGVGAGTIYRHFDSKEALVNAIYRQEKLRFAQFVLDGFPMMASTREQFRELWMRMAKFAKAHPDSFIFLEFHHHARYLDAESRAVENRMLQLFTGVVLKAQHQGELKEAPPRLLMGLVMGAFTGVIRSCVEVDQPLEQADWKMAEQCIWEAVRS